LPASTNDDAYTDQEDCGWEADHWHRAVKAEGGAGMGNCCCRIHKEDDGGASVCISVSVCAANGSNAGISKRCQAERFLVSPLCLCGTNWQSYQDAQK
jgi:hypothetical protein